MNSSLLGADCEDMVVFECVTVANVGCRCLEDCYGEVLRDCVFQQGYAGHCNECARVRVCVSASVDGWGRIGFDYVISADLVEVVEFVVFGR